MLCKNPYTFGVNSKVPAGFTVPCGSCISCRINYARFWAVRCYFESLEHDSNLFVTLTYNDEHLPGDGKISVRDIQTFFKRFRKAIFPRKVRYFLCGEYGPKTKRPHYHFILFGGFPCDETIIDSCWSKGFVKIQVLSDLPQLFYVAGYSLKSGRKKNSRGFHPKLLVSRRPGIGASAIDFFKKIYDKNLKYNVVIINGKKYAIPPYYLSKFIDETSRHSYMKQNALYFSSFKDEYFSLVRGKIESREAKSKLKQRMDL